MKSAVDGQLQGVNGPDRFRIKIWERGTERIIYDNEVGVSVDGEPTTELSGGSIVIHAGK